MHALKDTSASPRTVSPAHAPSPRLASGYLGPFSPRYNDTPARLGDTPARLGDLAARLGDPAEHSAARSPRLQLVRTASQHTPGGPPVDEPPPFPKPPAPEQDPPKEPVAPPVI